MTILPVFQRRQKPFARRLQAAARATAPWLLSVLAHALAMVAFGVWAVPAPAGAGGDLTTIELTCAFGEELAVGRFAPSVILATTQVPELIKVPSAMIHDAATATQAAPTAAQPTLPSPNPPTFPEQPVSYTSPAPAGAASPRPTLTQVFGVFARGTRFVYVFDRSASMEGRPLVAAKNELIASLADLAPRDRFQVIFYNDQPQLMSMQRHIARSLLLADESAKRLAARYIGGIMAEGSTNHLAALCAALELQPDVIFLLTDTAGEQLTPDQLARIRHSNRAAAIFTIEFGRGPRPPGPSFLERLALENRGQHTYIDAATLR